jgi:hypothetical protein
MTVCPLLRVPEERQDARSRTQAISRADEAREIFYWLVDCRRSAVGANKRVGFKREKNKAARRPLRPRTASTLQ